MGKTKYVSSHLTHIYVRNNSSHHCRHVHQMWLHVIMKKGKEAFPVQFQNSFIWPTFTAYRELHRLNLNMRYSQWYDEIHSVVQLVQFNCAFSLKLQTLKYFQTLLYNDLPSNSDNQLCKTGLSNLTSYLSFSERTAFTVQVGQVRQGSVLSSNSQ